jgi:hypothetical protein
VHSPLLACARLTVAGGIIKDWKGLREMFGFHFVAYKIDFKIGFFPFCTKKIDF